ncbi:MAG TPA: integrase core domain-containing protein, partial [Candidatus Didemnitutus sp.]
GVERPPACSTIGEILRRKGLSVKRRRRPGAYHACNEDLTVPSQPNHVWTVDFKGWFLLGNGQRCDPLTVCDLYSHYVLAVRAQPDQQFCRTWRTFRALMRQAGQPEIIRTDLGAPFASLGLGRLSSLSVWWIEQGIEVEFTRPASPQEKGSHERMHRDLKAEATQPPSADLAAQQRRFERWQHIYNHERPHEALHQQRPAEVYQPSARRLNENDRPIIYAPEFEVQGVSLSGQVAHGGKNYHLGEAFAGKQVGLRPGPDAQTELHFANVHLGHLRFDAEGGRFKPTAYVAPLPPPRLKAGRLSASPSTPTAQSSEGREPSPLPSTLPLNFLGYQST